MAYRLLQTYRDLFSDFGRVIGLYVVMDIAWKMEWRKVHFELDLEVVVNMVLVRCNEPHPCSSIVKAIQACMEKAWMVEITHYFHEANKVADRMACNVHKLWDDS